MTTSEIGILIAIIVYMVGVVGIGVYLPKKTVPQMILPWWTKAWSSCYCYEC